MKRGLALALVIAAAIAATAGATTSSGAVVKTAFNASLKKTILVAAVDLWWVLSPKGNPIK